MYITRTSKFSNITRTFEIDVTQAQLDAWNVDGKLIQDAMPNLNSSEREFIMSGMTDEEWDELYPEEED